MENNCIRCGRCCKSFPITKDVANKIIKYLYANKNILNQLKMKPAKKECVFLIHDSVSKTHCAIYDSNARPIVCDIFATKGYSELECPNGCTSTKYTTQEADNLLDTELKSSPVIGDLNSIINIIISEYNKNKEE